MISSCYVPESLPHIINVRETIISISLAFGVADLNAEREGLVTATLYTCAKWNAINFHEYEKQINNFQLHHSKNNSVAINFHIKIDIKNSQGSRVLCTIAFQHIIVVRCAKLVRD